MLRVLAIGGLDPCGGAGLAADLRMVHARGGMPLALVTALTVQNRYGVREVHPVEQPILDRSWEAVLEDGPLHAVKTGLFASAGQIRWAATRLRDLDLPVIVDPVLSATAGGWSAGRELVEAYLQGLLPLAALVTPNLQELDRLTGGGGASALLEVGCRAVLVKDGHGRGETVRDVLHTGGSRRELTHPRLRTGPVHGTGCALAAALAVYLAAGQDLAAACSSAIADLQRCLQETGPDEGGPPRPLKIV